MTIDKDLLGLYLSDHLTGATAGLGRLENMVENYPDLPIHDDLVRTRDELREEIGRVRELVDHVGTRPRRIRQAAAWAGEKAGRLKLNRRVLGRSPMTPLLELELLRSAVMGKQGMWQVLEDHAEQLGLDQAEFAERARQADEQRERVTRLHGVLRPMTFVEDSPIST